MKALMKLTVMAGVSALVGAVYGPAPAVAQGMQQTDQQITQEAAPGSGTQLSISPARVRQVQQSLNMRGYDAGSVDGNWGPQTQRAVLNFQQAQGLEPTGQLNRRTLASLGLSGGQQGQQQGQQQSQQGFQGQQGQGQ